MVTIADIQEENEKDTGLESPTGFLTATPVGYPQGLSTDEEVDYRTKGQKSTDAFLYAIPNTIIGGLSEITESMPGLDEEDADSLVKSLTTEGMYKDFQEKEEGYKLSGALISSLVPIIGTQKLMRAKSLYTKVEKVLGEKVTRAVMPNKISIEERVEALRQKATVLAKKQANTVNKEVNAELNSMIQKAGRSEAFDMFKIGVATDAGIYAMLNESDFFFPEEMSAIETAAMYGVPNAIFSGIGGAVMRYKLKNVLRDVGTIGGEARNLEGLPISEVLSRKGERSTLVTVAFEQAKVKQGEIANAGGDSVLRSNLESQQTAWLNTGMSQAAKIAEDSIYPGITSSYKINEAETATLLNASKLDPTTLMDTVSIEKFTVKAFTEINTKLQKQIDSLEIEIADKATLMSAMKKGALNRIVAGDELSILRKKLSDFQKSSVLKLDIDGSLSSVSSSKLQFKDKQTGKFKDISEKNLEAKISNSNFGTFVRIKNEKEVGFSYAARFSNEDSQSFGLVSSDFKMIIPQKAFENSAEIKKIVTFEEANLPENYKESLNIIGKVFHYEDGQMGKQISNSLSKLSVRVLDNWIDDPAKSLLRKNTPEAKVVFDEIYKANEGVRQALREIAGADGTIPLLRGESIFDSRKPLSDVVSMTSNPKTAEFFSGGVGHSIVVSRINPDDVVAVVGGAGDEFEFIVRGNLKRGIGDAVTSTNFSSLSFQGKTGLQDLTRKVIADWKPENAPIVNVNASMHHLQLDATLELSQKFGPEHPGLKSKIKFDDENITTWDDVEFTSLSKKYNEFVEGVETIGRQAEAILKLGKGQQKTLEDLIVELNLPNNGITGLHPLIEMFGDLQKNGVRSLQEVFPNLTVLKDDLKRLVQPSGDLLNEYMENPLASLRGSQLKTYTEKREPVLLVTKDSGVNPLSREELVNAATAQRMELIEGMKNSGAKGAPLIEAMTKEMLRDAERLKTAKDVPSLFEGSQLRSDRVTQTMFGLENQTTIQAIDSITNGSDNIVKSYISKKFFEHEKTFNNILSQNKKTDLNYFSVAVHQQGLGWRGLPDLVPVEENGKLIGYKIKLEDHASNKKMIDELYGVSGDDAKNIAFIPTPSFKKDTPYAPLVLTPLAAEAMLAVNQISQDVLSHINQLRKLSGLKEITRKPLHMIPKNLADKEKVFLLDANTGEMHSISSGATAIQAKAFAEKEIKNAKEAGVDLFIATEKDVENFNLLKLDDFTRMVDFSTSFKQTGQAKGTSFGQTIETGKEVLEKMQEGMINQYTTVSRVTSAMFFEPEIRLAQLSAQTSGLAGSTLDKGRTVWDSYIRRLLGKKSGDTKQTIGKVYGAAEDVYDVLLSKLKDQKVSALKGGQTQAQADKQWEGMQRALPDYNPFKDSIEFLEKTMRIKTPQSMIKHTTQLNAIAGATMLRMMELGLAAVNIMTLPTLIPVVVGALRKRPGQTDAQWKAEIGAWGSTIDGSTAIWNPYRATVTGTHFFFTEEGRSIIKEAGVKGHLWQKTVEQMQLFTSPSKGYAERMLTKAVDFTSIAVDKTEEWSRGLSYATFYKLGKDTLKLDKDSAMEFAHQQANKVIGDFRPNNRPQIFQGAAGMPFGLFTTFAWNYMQRVYGYLEKEQFSSFFKQMGLQAAFFGTKSLPGFNQYVDNFTSNYDGSENMVDRLQNAYGTETTDALLFGSVGSLTGIATYTRTDIRLPGSNYVQNFNITDMAPIAGMIKKSYDGVSSSMASIKANGGFNERQLSEIAARTFPIKAVRGWIELGNGAVVDSRGQIVNEKLNTATAIGAKMLAMKPLREQLLIEEMMRIRSTSLKRGEARKQFRLALRASFRAGDLNGDKLNNLIKLYGKSTDGDYSNLKTTIRNEMEFALINKGYLQAMKKASTESAKAGMLRMINIITNEDYE